MQKAIVMTKISGVERKIEMVIIQGVRFLSVQIYAKMTIK